MKHAISCLLTMLTMTACGTGVQSDPRAGSGSSSDSDNGESGPFQGTSNACPEIDGPRHPYATLDEARPLIIGRWIHCVGPTPTPLNDGIGIEIAADGKYYMLVSDGHGGLMRGTGFTAQGTWDLNESGDVFLELWPRQSTEILGSPVFEDHPRRFAFDPLAGGTLTIFQAITP
jgi:hypothetical protein